MLRGMDPAETDAVFVPANVDVAHSRFGEGLPGPDVPYKLREQSVTVVRLQPERDALRVVQRLQQTDGVQERRVVGADARSVPAMFPHNFGDLLFHAHLRRRTLRILSAVLRVQGLTVVLSHHGGALRIKSS